MIYESAIYIEWHVRCLSKSLQAAKRIVYTIMTNLFIFVCFAISKLSLTCRDQG